MSIELKKEDTVKGLVALFNAGEIKYQDIQDLFSVSRDLIKDRLKGIGLSYDNSTKMFVGEAAADDLDIKLVDLFQKQRANQFTKTSIGNANVGTNEIKEPKNVSAVEHSTHKNQPTNVDVKRAKEEFEQANKEAAPTLAQTNQLTNVVRKRSSFDIDVDLMKELKITAITHDKPVYLIVESAIRKELAKMKKR